MKFSSIILPYWSGYSPSPEQLFAEEALQRIKNPEDISPGYATNTYEVGNLLHLLPSGLYPERTFLILSSESL